jgi:hypothetical protein
MLKKEGVIRVNKVIRVILIFSLFIIFLFLFQSDTGFATSSTNATNTSVVIWDNTDSEGGGLDKRTIGNHADKTDDSHWNTFFYANYTKNDTTYEIINDNDGNCTIRIDENNNDSLTIWVNMSFNSTANLWIYNRSFTAKGLLDWEVNCTTTLADYETVNISEETVKIINTEPWISGESYGWINDGFPCEEETICYYNFSGNCSEDDLNDILIYNLTYINSINPTNYDWFSINSSSGIIKINATTDSEAGDYSLELEVRDTEIEGTGASQSDTSFLGVNITAVNDAPSFISLPTNATEGVLLNENVIVSDEEDDRPFFYNLTFMDNCSLANWSSRTNCTLFSINELTGNILFTPTNDDVGNYTINFTVTDSGSPNATNTTLGSFEVININNPPWFVYVCDDERNTTEDTNHQCWINASDEDEIYNITFESNYSWFTFNNSQIIITMNVSGRNASALVEFTPNDTAVGNHSVKIDVTDSAGSTNDTTIYFFVNNTHDNPLIPSFADQTCYANITCTKEVNASDDDLLIPLIGKTVYNESLNISINSSLFSITKTYESEDGSSRVVLGSINFIPTGDDQGVHVINITVTDNSSLIDSTTFTLTIGNNTYPIWNESKTYEFDLTEDENFLLNISNYTTDADDDTITFYSNISGSEFPSFSLTTIGIINFTPIDQDVGLHNVKINATDGVGNSTHLFIFNVSNVNDNPIFQNISDVETQEENQTIISFYVQDDDFLIQNKEVYNETLSFLKNITNLTGEYRSLFNITIQSIIDNKTWALIDFTPVNDDVGNYTILINVTDMSNSVNSTSFNLNITDINNAPTFAENITTQSAGVDILFLMNITAEDKDGDDIIFYSNTSWFTFNDSKINIINVTIETQNNSATALINNTPSDSEAGTNSINITIGDGIYNTSTVFDIKVYDEPTITITGYNNLSENETFYCSSIAEQNVSENLNCILTLQNSSLGNKINSTTCIGVNTIYLETNFTFEGTYTAIINVSNSFYSVTSDKSIVINHSNAPIAFLTNINNIEVSGTSTSINLSEYFYDVDNVDSKYNQSINFSSIQYENTTYCENEGENVSTLDISITRNINSYSATFSTSQTASSIVKITAIDSENEDYNASSNCFSVNMTVVSAVTEVPTPSTGGGGAGAKKPLSIKIIVPEPFSMDAMGTITVPIELENVGVATLNGITIGVSTERKTIVLKLSKTSIASLSPNEKKKIDLTIKANAPEVIDIEPVGITVVAEVKSPDIDDSAVILFNLIEHDREKRLKAEEKQKMLMEYIISNPECLELEEVLKEAAIFFDKREYDKSIGISENAIQACKSFITGRVTLQRILDWREWPTLTLGLIIFTIILFILISASFFFLKRRKFK